nr:MAG TPA: hypothetical protein [Caudoviricetes sp.]
MEIFLTKKYLVIYCKSNIYIKNKNTITEYKSLFFNFVSD